MILRFPLFACWSYRYSCMWSYHTLNLRWKVLHRLGCVDQSESSLQRPLDSCFLPANLGIHDLAPCVYSVPLFSEDSTQPQTHTSTPGTHVPPAPSQVFVSFCFVFRAGLEPRTLCMLGKHFITEPHLQPGHSSLLKNKYRVKQVGQPTSVVLGPKGRGQTCSGFRSP